MHDLATVAKKILAFREERNRDSSIRHESRRGTSNRSGELQEAMIRKTDEEDWDPNFWRVRSGQSGPQAQDPLPLEKKLQAAREFRSQARPGGQDLSLIKRLAL